ncbi:transcription factor Tfb2-domain-containing protein [Kockovaella imperatae]|uniref:RNA polymerase II transcription factor B subunit 2 n=1 Tax=Kockovaella imperatae TaxID=4999 RepID=A0A1Y1UI47_9TREE|nr:transcription factor Tfb2-domain-containing protein [Kockovaella imperatae]ORX37154.1 transcription factor Tfb2-domain-containing protein [Kockovaella imperatae]
MVQPSFSHPRKPNAEEVISPTAPLDAFLDNQHQSFFEELYKSEAVCLCILRFLPPICRHVVLHTLWSYNPLRTVDLKALCQIDVSAPLNLAEDIVRSAIDRKIFHPIQHKKGKMEWPMNDTFKKGLRNALTGLGKSNSFGVPYVGEDGIDAPDPEELIQYGEDTWESILKYMVSSGLSSSIATVKPKPQVLRLLHASGLMADNNDMSGRRPNLDRLTITSKGFQFLLEDRQTQLWQILMCYLALKEADSERSAETLSVFFSLGCMQLGDSYSASGSFPLAHSALDDLESYGFIYRRPVVNGVPSDQFFPTHLATSLCSGNTITSASQSADEKRFLVLETNYKIYAYTSNELEIAILNLFVDIRIRYRNLVVGKLDRKNVKSAMEKGISAYQIISYLASHAHPQMYNSPPPLLHPTIVDQLHLWDKERNRLKHEDAVMFEFHSKELFDDTEAEARRYDGVLVSVPNSKLLFIDPSIKDGIRDFVMGQQKQLRGA